MALKFGDSKGKAQKGVETYNYKDNENTVRLIGGILARYVYWVKASNGKDIPIECLAFDRTKEKFANKEVDHVPAYFPDKKCSWAYVMLCIDPSDGKVKPINLKKKLFEQVMQAASDGLGDPTDFDTGWDIQFRKTKTGPLAFNVEYTLQVLKCKSRALTANEREAVNAALTSHEAQDIDTLIDKIYPRPTPEDVRNLCERIVNGASEEESQETPDAQAGAQQEAINDLAR